MSFLIIELHQRRSGIHVVFGVNILLLVEELNSKRIDFICDVIRNDFVRCVVVDQFLLHNIVKRWFCILWLCKEHG